MKRSQLATAIKLAMTGVLAGALVACGGGGSGGGTSSSTATTGTSVGAVTGFGSVFVNGKRFTTSDDSVSSEDGIESEIELEKGMIVKVNGSWDDSTGEGAATEIEYDDTLRGPLTNATWDEAASSGELTVAGQTVLLDSQTIFRGATPTELATNPSAFRVRISAWSLANGNFRASFVGAGTEANGIPSDDQFNEVEVKGVVFGHDDQLKTFRLNSVDGLQVNYDGPVEIDENFSFDDLNGRGVEVEGELVGGVLNAGEIGYEDDFFGLTGTIEFQGAIEGDYDATAQQFVLNGVTVQVSNGTEFKDGLLESELAAGLLVEVEGSFNSDNVLVAREIEPKDGDAEVEATIESIDRVNETMVVGGVKVALSANTLIEDDVDGGSRNWSESFASLEAGHFVEVEGRFRNGVLEAVSIERDDPDTEFDLDGRVTENTGDSITVLGVNLLAQNCISGFSLETFPIGTAVEVDYFKDAGGSYLIRKLNEDRPDPEVDGPDVICSDGPDDSDSDDS